MNDTRIDAGSPVIAAIADANAMGVTPDDAIANLWRVLAEHWPGWQPDGPVRIHTSQPAYDIYTYEASIDIRREYPA